MKLTLLLKGILHRFRLHTSQIQGAARHCLCSNTNIHTPFRRPDSAHGQRYGFIQIVEQLKVILLLRASAATSVVREMNSLGLMVRDEASVKMKTPPIQAPKVSETYLESWLRDTAS